MRNTPKTELVKKWAEMQGKISVGSIADEDIKGNLATLLENQEQDYSNNYGMLTEATNALNTAAGVGGQFQPISLALVRRTFPELFANKVVGVQAMNGPVGLAYALRTQYQDAEGTYDEMWQDKVHSGYTGSAATHTSAGVGAPTATAEGWLINNAGTSMPMVKVLLEKIAITAATRKLASSFSLETIQDIKAMHNLDLEREIVNVLHYELLAELDRELVAKLKAAAVVTTSGGSAATSFDVSASDGRWSQEKYSNVVNQIVYQANQIAVSTKRGAGNFVIVSPRVATAIQSAHPQFTANTSSLNATNVFVNVGSINGTIQVYRDIYATTDYALVGYKGAGISDAGVLYCPYITGLTNKAIDPYDFSPRIGVMSRYAIVDNLLGSGRYYRQIDFSNLASVIGA